MGSGWGALAVTVGSWASTTVEAMVVEVVGVRYGSYVQAREPERDYFLINKAC